MIELPVEAHPKLEFLYRPTRFKVLWGGRGGIKSWGVARALIQKADSTPLRILCARELQLSIQESVHHLLETQIHLMGLDAFFTVQQASITSSAGAEFIFSGIKSNPTKIKSMEGIDICWVEEAEKVSRNSWEILIPTIRKAGSEIWVTFNPDEEADPTSQMFLLNPPEDAVVVETNWRDADQAGWFPDELRRAKDYLFRVDPDAAMHVWEGKYRRASKAAIFSGKWIVDSFVPVLQEPDARCPDYPVDPFSKWRGPYYGADWGFSGDPTVLMKLWLFERRLYIEKESVSYRTESDEIPGLWRAEIPEVEGHTIRADNSRPETINHVAKSGLRVIAANKWQGSVEDGIKFIRSFEQIVIHPRCKNQIFEARNYKWKVDPVTEDVLPIIVDKHNHSWDSDRYALEPVIKRRRSMFEVA